MNNDREDGIIPGPVFWLIAGIFGVAVAIATYC